MKNLRPLGERLIVERAKPADQTTGGILLPQNAKDKPVVGKVIAIGEREEGKQFCCKVGDNVFFKAWGGEAVPKEYAGDRDLLIINYGDLWAVEE